MWCTEIMTPTFSQHGGISLLAEWRSAALLSTPARPPACVMSYPRPRLNGADLLLKRPLRRRWLPNQILFIDQTAMRGAPHSFCASQSVAHLAASEWASERARCETNVCQQLWERSLETLAALFLLCHTWLEIKKNKKKTVLIIMIIKIILIQCDF